MPCTDGTTDRDRLNEAWEKVDRLTRMLCGLCHRLERDGYDFSVVSDLPEWWREHKRIDAERAAAAKEAARIRREQLRIKIREMQIELERIDDEIDI